MEELGNHKVINRLRGFIGIFLVGWIVGLVFLFIWGYEDSFLKLNGLRTTWLDVIMPHYTHLGEGVLVGGIWGLMVIRRDKGLVMLMILNLFLILLIIPTLKQVVFTDWDRPLAVFTNKASFFYSGLGGERFNAFPSGHSAVAASIFSIIAFWNIRDNSILKGIFWGLIAISVCYSRVYVGAHFLGDILVGSLVGILLSTWLLSQWYEPVSAWFSRLDPRRDRMYSLLLYLIVSLLLGGTLIKMYHTYYQ